MRTPHPAAASHQPTTMAHASRIEELRTIEIDEEGDSVLREILICTGAALSERFLSP